MIQRTLTVTKDGKKVVFRYDAGAEQEVIDEIIRHVEADSPDLSWFDAAMLSFLSGRLPNSPSTLHKLTSTGRARRMDLMHGGDKVEAPAGDHPRVTAIRPSEDSTRGGAVYFDERSTALTDP